jgi:hypothetical protein
MNITVTAIVVTPKFAKAEERSSYEGSDSNTKAQKKMPSVQVLGHLRSALCLG